MKKNLILALSSILILSACNNTEKPVQSIPADKQEPIVGQVIQDKLNLKDDVELEVPVYEPTYDVVTPSEESIDPPPVTSLDPTQEDYAYSIKVIKACDDLVHTITKNVPKKDKPFTFKSQFEKVGTSGSKVTVGFESLNAQQIRNSYIGSCEFDLEGNLLSFSAEPIKSNSK